MSIKDEIKKRMTKKAIMTAIIAAIKPLALLLAAIILFGFIDSIIHNFLSLFDGTVQEGDDSNVPYLFKEYTEDTEIIGREITSKTTVKEIWKKVIKNNGRIKEYLEEYLDKPEELQKLMNAEICTSFLDLRENPDAPIDWKKLNSDVNSNVLQGIVKLKRARETGEYITMTYVDPATFQSYIDAYNASGSDADKDKALSHFTLEKGYNDDSLEGDSVGFGGNYNYTIGTDGIAKPIEEGESIEVPQEDDPSTPYDDSKLGTTFIFNYWQNITGEGTGQLRLIREAGMNFDEEGFGRINGRYAVAVKQTFGKVGDYIDYYYKDKNGNEQMLPCIIVDVKGQDAPNPWGHHEGKNMIEFYVNRDQWGGGHENPGQGGFHDELSGTKATKVVNGGSYFDNPNFRADAIEEKNENSRENNISKVVTSTEKLASTEKTPIGQTTILGEKEDETKSTDYEDTGSEDEKMCWPTDSTYISSPFGLRTQPTEGASTNHGGIDIGYVATGDNVYAAESGVVVLAGYNGGAGLMVAIDHGNGYVTKYMHNSGIKVQIGDKVTKGQVIAAAGSTGVSTGTHVHFQIEHDGQKIDPLRFAYKNASGEDVAPSNTNSGSGSGGIGYNMDKAIENYETGNYPAGSGYGNPNIEGKYYAKIAIWEETTETLVEDGNTTSAPPTTYHMTTANVNYEKIVKGYTMPFEFLWSFLLVGQQKEFVLELADLVFDSRVEISILDSIRTNTNVTTYTYTEHVDVETYDIYAHVKGWDNTNDMLIAEGDYGPSSGKGSYDVPHTAVGTTETKTNTIDVILSIADVWLLKVEQGYSTQTSTTTSSSDAPHADVEHEPVTDNGDPVGIAAKYASNCEKEFYRDRRLKMYEDVKMESSTTQTSKYNRKDINGNTHVDNTVYFLKNLANPPKVEEKTDPDSIEPNFVTIYRKKEYEKNGINVFTGPEWIFQILEADESTADMVDIAKYLIYKANDEVKSYDGVEEMDWDVFWISEYKTLAGSFGIIGGGGGGGYGNYYFASSGIEGSQGEIFDYLLARGVPSRGVSAIIGNIEKQVNNGETTWEEAAKNFADLWKKIFEENPELFEAIMNAKDEETMEYAAWLLAKFQGDIIENNFEASKDKISEQLTNALKWQTEFEEKNPASVIGDGSDILGTCYLVMNEMLQNEVHYDNDTGKNDYPLNTLEYYDIDDSSNYYVHKGQDCGGFVASVLYRSGAVTQEEWSRGVGWHHPQNLITTLWKIGWDINISPSDLQPGDVISSGGHVGIYAGDGQYWDVYSGCVESQWRGGTRDVSNLINSATDLHIARPNR